MNWLQKVKEGLAKTARAIGDTVSLSAGRKLDAAALDDLEDSLLMADLGVEVTSMVRKELSGLRLKSDLDEGAIRAKMREILLPIVSRRAGTLTLNQRPHVVLLCGVNGNGKTTTAGKLAAKLMREGKSVLLVACDTFRAAAVQQLQIWAERVGAGFFAGEEGADPASVAYRAVEKGYAEGVDVVILDTAGRLHNKQNLMDELGKIHRVLRKFGEGVPHDCVLVIDATTGQNALMQVEFFSKVLPLTGLIITKLDGTAKGGILVGVAHKFDIPIVCIGVGEAVDDLGVFDPEVFVDALVG